MSSYLVNSQRADTSSVGFCMAAYYMAVTLGRFLIGITAKRITVATLIHFGIALTVLSLPLALYARGLWLVVGISLLGLGVAPIHPFTLYETHQRFEASRASKIISYQISASLIGGLAIPAAIGFAMSTIGSWIMAPFLIVLFAIVLVIRLSVIITRRF